MLRSSCKLRCLARPRQASFTFWSGCADVIARLQHHLFDWALHPNGHITTSNEKIAAYADNQLQVKGGVLIGIWDEAELAAIRAEIAQRAKG